jgi:hypothetical protein
MTTGIDTETKESPALGVRVRRIAAVPDHSVPLVPSPGGNEMASRYPFRWPRYLNGVTPCTFLNWRAKWKLSG